MIDPSKTHSPVIYSIDSADVIDHVNAAWNEFAIENSGKEYLADYVVGKKLWDFITGAEARFLSQKLAERVRQTRKALQVPFRCDAPDLRRYMTMAIVPKERNGLSFVCDVVRRESREPISILDPTRLKSDQFLMMCSWCKRIEVDKVWHEIEDGITALGLFEVDEVPQISHTMCQSCLERLGTGS